MSEAVLFLLGAVALSALGGLIVWVLSRPRQEKFGNTIDSFSKDLNALAPSGSAKRRRKRPAPAAPAPTDAKRSPSGPKQSGPPRRNGAVVQIHPRPRPGPQSRQKQQ